MSNTKQLQYADSALQNRSYVIALEGVACDTSETAVYSIVRYTKAETSNTAKRIVARHLEYSLSVLESKKSLAGKLTYLFIARYSIISYSMKLSKE